ncbi:MAG: PEGA domain-containing protein [bacterium]|nr:PEGA domain-containing protein [bacterium]
MRSYIELLRRLLFHLFVAAYIGICPWLMLFAFGYIYDPVRGGLARIGGLSISTRPPGAIIFMDGKRYLRTTPAAIGSVIAGEYEIRLVKKGFLPWIHKVSIPPNRFVSLDHVVLLPPRYDRRELFDAGFSDLLQYSDRPAAVAFSGRTVGNVRLLDFERGESSALFPRDEPWSDYSVREALSVYGTDRVLFEIASWLSTRYLFADLTAGTWKDITPLLPDKPRLIAWNRASPDILFGLHGDTIVKMDAGGGAYYPRFFPGVRGFGLNEKNLYILSGKNTVLQCTYDAMCEAYPLPMASSVGTVLEGAESEFFSIEVPTGDIVLFAGDRGELILNAAPYRVGDEKIAGTRFSRDTGKLLLWTRTKIGYLDLSRVREGPTPEEVLPQWVYEGGRAISRCFWVYDASHVLFQDGNELELLHPEPGGSYALHRVAGVKNRSRACYSEATGKVYFISADTGAVVELELLR